MYKKPIVTSYGIDKGAMFKKPKNKKIRLEDKVYAYESSSSFIYSTNVNAIIWPIMIVE